MEKETMCLLVNGEQAFPEIIRCIQEAKTTLEINMFIWRDDQIGNAVAQAVLSAADRGVQVDISVDRYGVVLEKCEETKRSFFHKNLSLTEKIKIRALELFYPQNSPLGQVKDEASPLYPRIMSHPNITVQADVFKADHSKYYIIDEKILFLGGINIEDKENGQDLTGRVYGDYMVKLQGWEYVRAFREKLATGQNIRQGLSFGINLKTPIRRFEMEQLYLDLIAHAKTELHITMAYFSPMKKFLKAILAAQERGVQVTVMIPAQANFQNDSNRRTVRKLLKASQGRIGVYLSPKMLHTKLVMNDQYISLGSTNITKKAFSQLNELNLTVENTHSTFQKTLMANVHRELQAAQQIHRWQDISYNPLMAFLEGFLV